MERRVKSIHLFLGVAGYELRVVNRKHSFFITRTPMPLTQAVIDY